MHILGINGARHACSSCLISNGAAVAMTVADHFTRVGHGKRPLSFTAWQALSDATPDCLQQAGSDAIHVSHIASSCVPFRLHRAATKMNRAGQAA